MNLELEGGRDLKARNLSPIKHCEAELFYVHKFVNGKVQRKAAVDR